MEIGKRQTRRCPQCGATGLLWYSGPMVGKGAWLFNARAGADGRFYPTETVHLCKVDPPAWGRRGQDPDDSETPAQAPIPAPTGTPLDLGAMIAQTALPALQASIGRIVQDALDARPPHRTVLEIRSPKGWTVDIETTDEHPKFETLCRLFAARRHVFLYGPPGAGKTTAVQRASDAVFGKGRFGYISLNPQTADSRVQGFIDAHGVYRDTQYRARYSEGGVFLFDEVCNGSDNMLTTMNAALENGHAAFPDGMIPRHGDFVCAAADNTAGLGGTMNHAGRRRMDAAFRERFVFVYWGHDERLEARLTMAENQDAGAWLAWVRKVRALCGEKYPDVLATPRASIIGAALLRDGVFQTAADLADAVVFKGIDTDTRAAILNACPLPAVTHVA